jgi:hypothetical protein
MLPMELFWKSMVLLLPTRCETCPPVAQEHMVQAAITFK